MSPAAAHDDDPTRAIAGKGAHMSGEQELHDLRSRAHEAGIAGNSKMTAQELRSALRSIRKGNSPEEAQATAEKGR